MARQIRTYSRSSLRGSRSAVQDSPQTGTSSSWARNITATTSCTTWSRAGLSKYGHTTLPSKRTWRSVYVLPVGTKSLSSDLTSVQKSRIVSRIKGFYTRYSFLAYSAASVNTLLQIEFGFSLSKPTSKCLGRTFLCFAFVEYSR